MNNNQAVDLESLEISIDQAEVIKDDEMKTVTGGRISYINPNTGTIYWCIEP